jgi:hypothetical protein
MQDDGDDYYSTPYHAFSSLTLTGNENTTTSGATASGSIAVTQSGSAAPHVRSANTAAASSSGYVPPHLRTAGSKSSSIPDYTPPHLRGDGSAAKPKYSEAARSVSSVSNPYATNNGSTINESTVGESTIGGSTVGWSAVDARRRAVPPINPTPAANLHRAPAPPPPAFRPQVQASQPPPTTLERESGNWARAVSFPLFHFI